MRIKKDVWEFDWDKGNIEKNKKHDVKDKETEEPFFDEEKILYKDTLHSKKEERFILIGRTKKGRLLYIVFTERGEKVRVISARNINKKEVAMYEKKA